MARKKRIHYSGAFYHVMLRGNLGEQIFHSDQDRYFFYSLLKFCVNEYKCTIYAFCLMNNHIHLAIQVSDTPLAKIMHIVAFRYAQWINKTLNRNGHLFQGRYKAILVDSDSYLKELVRYIHLNPVRANITTTPDEYKWSSHLSYLDKQFLSWLNSKWVLSCFSNDRENAIKNYLIFLGSNVTKESDKKFQTGNKNTIQVLADDAFIKRLPLLCSPQQNRTNDSLGLYELAESVASYYSVTIDALKNPYKSLYYSKIRTIIALLAAELCLGTLANLAAFFNRDTAVLARAVRKFNNHQNTRLEVSKIKDYLKGLEQDRKSGSRV